MNPHLDEYIKGQIGRTIKDKYKVETFLGSGASGHVFLVNDELQKNQE